MLYLVYHMEGFCTFFQLTKNITELAEHEGIDLDASEDHEIQEDDHGTQQGLSGKHPHSFVLKERSRYQ